MELLRSIGVEVRTGSRVAEVREDGVVLSTGELLPSELVVWSAGVKAPDVLKDIDGLETNRINQLVVSATLQTTRDPAIFAIGDCACCPRPGTTLLSRRGTSCASNGGAYGPADRPAARRQAAGAVSLPGLWLSCVAGKYSTVGT